MELVELCPFCMKENTYPDWNVDRQGFVAKCSHCGEEILLCDECHQIAIENGQSHMCDWEETETGGKCRRGEWKRAEFRCPVCKGIASAQISCEQLRAECHCCGIHVKRMV